VIDAAATKPFGFMPFYPGPGIGWHCIPLDPYYLSWKMKTLNYRARFIELAGEINAEMPHHVVNKVVEGLNQFEKSVKGSEILVLGVAYKADIDDYRESPALDIMNVLRQRGALVKYSDPHVSAIAVDGETLSSVELSPATLSSADCVVLATAHAAFDVELIVRESRLIVDARNALRGTPSGGAVILRI
jgi:UDP-N-acetyl-D-glucosamine dehydrogenase